MLALFITVDVVTSLIVLAGIAFAVAVSGLSAGALARRLVPLLLAAAGLGVFNTLFGTTHDPATGLAIALRVLGIALSGVVMVATIDPTDLADALVQHLHAPPRFVVGALAAFRLFPLFSREWDTLGLARRARGIEADRTIVDRAAAFPGRALGLLVAAIRRATRLAIAMDARGFGSRDCRTLARPRPFTLGDWSFLAIAVAWAELATAASIALGTYRPLIGF